MWFDGVGVRKSSEMVKFVIFGSLYSSAVSRINCRSLWDSLYIGLMSTCLNYLRTCKLG